MASIIGICNSALARIGQPKITDLEAYSKRAELCKKWFGKSRDSALTDYGIWKASVRASVLQNPFESTHEDYPTMYYLWDDYLKVLKVMVRDDLKMKVPYHVENGVLFTIEDAAIVRHIHRLIDPNNMSSYLRETISCVLAKNIAPSFEVSKAVVDVVDYSLKEFLLKAKAVDEFEDFPAEA